jgi:hypothetical protein
MKHLALSQYESHLGQGCERLNSKHLVGIVSTPTIGQILRTNLEDAAFSKNTFSVTRADDTTTLCAVATNELRLHAVVFGDQDLTEFCQSLSNDTKNH